MIKEVIVVEGKSDIQRLAQAVEAECIATEGYTLRRAVVEQIRIAYEKRGIIILTDPDGAGERIRRTLSKKFPNAKHAFVPKEDATAHNDVGIEQASPEAIRRALEKVHSEQWSGSDEFSMDDLFRCDLVGDTDSAKWRGQVGAMLGIGYSNGKQFLYRLNHYGITREDFEKAVASLKK